MARTRSIKPGFFSNEYLAELPFEARLLFVGLWTLADRRGRLEDRPKGIQGRLFPFDNVDVDPLLQQLEDSPENFIIRYEAEGRRYIQITNFEKHQHINIKEQESTIPAPDKHGTSTMQAPNNNDTCTIPAPDEHALLPFTSYPLPSTSYPPPIGGGNVCHPEFEKFWAAYPRKLNEEEARKAYAVRIKDGYAPAQLEAAAMSYADECKAAHTEERYIKHPRNFLNDVPAITAYLRKAEKAAEPDITTEELFAEWAREAEEDNAPPPDVRNPFEEWR